MFLNLLNESAISRNKDNSRYLRILKKIDHSFQFRYEIYNDTLKSMLSEDSVWLDAGCGENENVAQFGFNCRAAIGIDLIKPNNHSNALFVQADLRTLPFPNDYADLITFRMVVEHIQFIKEEFSDILRVLKKNGKLLILTTNIWSPVILFPRLLPFKLKKFAIKLLFPIEGQDIFPTYHRFNSVGKMKRGIGSLKLVHLKMIEQTSLLNPTVFYMFLIPYLLTKNKIMRNFRSNILAIFENDKK